MKVDVYKSTKHGEKYLTVPVDTKVEDMKFPVNIDLDLLSLSLFKTSLEIAQGEKRVGVNTDDIIR